MEENTLGVQNYVYVSCPTCGKILAGDIQHNYVEYHKIAQKEINELMIPNLSYDDKIRYIESEMEKYNVIIFQKLGIKRYCCMTRLISTLQISVGATNPSQNKAIDRQSEHVSKKGYQRSMTIISLSTYSRVPGKGGYNMMSVMGKDDSNIKQWESYNEKLKLSTVPEHQQFKTVVNEKIIKGKVPTFNLNNINIPITYSGESRPINSEYISMLSDVELIGDIEDIKSNNIDDMMVINKNDYTIEDKIDTSNIDDLVAYDRSLMLPPS